MICTETTRTS